MRRLFIEAGNPVVFVHRDDSEAGGFLDGNVDGADDRIRALGDEPMVHLRIVHLVNVIAGEDQQEFRVFSVDQEHILIHGVGGAAIPIFADTLLRRNRGDIFAQFGVENIPAGPDMAIERVRLVLNEDGDLAESGVQAIAQGKVDDAIFPAKGNSRLRALVGERKESFAFPAGQAPW